MPIIKLFKKVYKKIPKGNSILANGHMFDHVYYQIFQKGVQGNSILNNGHMFDHVYY